jgi:hypothetical protein
MIKLLIKIFLTEIMLTILPVVIFQKYFEAHLREAHPILDTIETVLTFIFCQGALCTGGLLFLGLLYLIWTL